MKILALETSTPQSSVAILNNQHVNQRSIGSLRQAALLQPLIAEILAEEKLQLSDLNAVAYSAGPGSFTGLRIGAAFAQGLAFSANLALIEVPSLQVWAQQAYEQFQCSRVLVAVDAKMQQIYWGVYQLDQENIMQALQADQLRSPEQLISPKESEWLAVGDAWNIFNLLDQDSLSSVVKEKIDEFYPHADIVAKLAEYYFSQGKLTPLESVAPVYLRGQEAWKKIK